MKKILVLVFTFFISLHICCAEEKITVEFDSCVDGDTANVILDDEKIKIRLLAIDTPETKHPTTSEEAFGKEASEFTCNKLMNAEKIEIEYDGNSDKLDKYDRHLVWIWIDDYLLQDEIIKQGLGEVAYLYGEYKYTGTLENHQSIAKANKIGIWNEEKINEALENENSEQNYLMIGIIVGAGIVLLLTGNLTKTHIKKIKKGIKKYGA